MMPVSARHLQGDAWEVSLPKRKSAVRGKDGIRPRRTVHAATQAEAIALGREVFEREYIAYKMGVTMDLAELAVYWFDHAQAEGLMSEDTATDYRNAVKRYVAPNFAVDADKATAMEIERLYSHLLQAGGRDGGVHPNTIRKLNTALRHTYAFLMREGVVASSPMQEVKLPKAPPAVKRALTEREFSRLMDALERELAETPADAEGIERRNCMFGIYLDLHIGARVGEICALTRGDVRSVEEALRIEHSLSERGGLHSKAPKTASGRRTVALGAGPFVKLREHYAWQATYLSDAQRDSDETPLCCKATGAPIRPRDMSRAFKAFCLGEGVNLKRGESFHIMRHTHATLLLANKANPEAVRERLGHSRIETTLGYGHVMPGEGGKVAEDYGGIVERTRRGGGLR